MLGRRQVLGGAAALLGGLASGESRADRRLSFVYFNDFAPYSESGPDRRADGLLISLVQLVADELDWRMEHKGYPWERAQVMVRAGYADGFCTFPSAERQRYCAFVDQPLYHLDSRFLHFHRDNPAAARIRAATSLDHLREFRIADYIGNGWGRTLFGDWPNVHRTPTVKQAIEMVALRRADLMVLAPEILTQHLGDDRRGLTHHPAFFLPNGLIPFHVGLRRSLSDVEDRVTDFARAQALLRGELDAVAARFRGS